VDRAVAITRRGDPTGGGPFGRWPEDEKKEAWVTQGEQPKPEREREYRLRLSQSRRDHSMDVVLLRCVSNDGQLGGPDDQRH